MMPHHITHNIQFHFLVPVSNFKNRTELKGFLHKLFKRERKKFESLTYIFCSDDYLLNINKNFLNHDYFTDIITFNLSTKQEEITGEIYISIDRVKDNSKNLTEPFYKELHRVIFHGALHLCGYKDKTKGEIGLMRNKEAEYLKRYLK